MIKNIILLSSMILSLFSFNIYAQTEPSNNDYLVKKYFVGKPGYNRRIVEVYQKKVVPRGSQQLVSNAPAEGLISFNKAMSPLTVEKTINFYERLMCLTLGDIL